MVEEHNCENNLSFLKLKSSDKSLKYQCNICKTLYRKVVNQFNHVNNEYIPYKCAGYMIKNGTKVKCDALTNKFYRNYAYCENHMPRKIIVSNSNNNKNKDNFTNDKRNFTNDIDKLDSVCYSLRIESEERDSYKGVYDNVKDNLSGYLEF